MNQIIHHLKNSNNLFLATHVNPDGDAIGSLIAMGLSLESLNKRTTLYNESPIPAVYRFLPFADRIVQNVDKANIYDTAIILDCSDLERIGKAVSMVNKIPIIRNWCFKSQYILAKKNTKSPLLNTLNLYPNS